MYYIPMKKFTEVSRSRPRLLSVKDFDGRNLHPEFSPNGGSFAFFEEKLPIDENEGNRVNVADKVHDCRLHPTSDTDVSMQQSEMSRCLFPLSAVWSDNGGELCAIALDQGLRKLYKIFAALS